MISKKDQLVIVFDFENTLVVRDYALLASCLVQQLSDKLKGMNSEALSGYGLKTIPNWCSSSDQSAICTKIINFYKELRNVPDLDCDISLEVALFKLIVDANLLEQDAKSITELKEKEIEKLRELCQSIANDEKCMTIGYTLLEDIKEELGLLLTTSKFIFSICATTPLPVVQKTIKILGVDNLFQNIFVSGEVGSKKGKAEAILQARKAYADFGENQIIFVGDLIDTDMEYSTQNGFKAIWFDRKAWNEKRNNESIGKWKTGRCVHMAFSEYVQLKSLLAILLEDLEFLNGKSKETILPSSKRLKVGYYFPPKKVREMALKRVIASNQDIIFYPIQIRADLECQGPFDAIIHKCSDLMIAEYVTKKNKLFTKLREYTESKEKTMITIDPLAAMKATLYRTDTNIVLDKALATPLSQEIMKKFNLRMKTPYYRTLQNNNVEESLKAVKSDIESKKCNYNFMIKLSESCQTVESHTLAIVLNEEGLKKVLDMGLYKGKEIIVQQLVKHFATQYKLYSMGESYFTYFAKKSLPSVLPIENFAIFDSQKPFPKEWFTGKEEAVDKMNKEFVFAMTKEVLRGLNMSIVGADFIIEEESGDYYIIDVNYFSSFRNEKDLNPKITQHILNTYSGKIKGTH